MRGYRDASCFHFIIISYSIRDSQYRELPEIPNTEQHEAHLLESDREDGSVGRNQSQSISIAPMAFRPNIWYIFSLLIGAPTFCSSVVIYIKLNQ